MSALSSKVPTTRGRMPCFRNQSSSERRSPESPLGSRKGAPSSERGKRRRWAAARRSAPEDRHAALAEQVAVGPHLDRRRGRGVGEDEVQRVDRQLGDETLRPLVHAVQLDRLGEVEGRLEYLVGDQLGHDHGHSHRQARRLRDPALHRLLQLAAEGEDLVRVAIDGAADVGEDHRATGANEQLLPEGFLQLPELAADRGLRDVELLARPRHAAFADHRPEVEEVVMVERVHAPTIHRSAPMGHPQNRYWTASARRSLDWHSRKEELRYHAAAARLRIDVTGAGLVAHEGPSRRGATARAPRHEPVRPGGSRRDGAPRRVAQPPGRRRPALPRPGAPAIRARPPGRGDQRPDRDGGRPLRRPPRAARRRRARGPDARATIADLRRAGRRVDPRASWGKDDPRLGDVAPALPRSPSATSC